MIFQEIYQSSFSQSKPPRRTDYDSRLKELKCYLCKRWSLLIKYRSSKKPILKEKPELGQKCRRESWGGAGWHLPCLAPPGACPCAAVGLAGQAECSESPGKCGRGAFSSAGWDSSPELFMVVLWHRVLGVGLVLAAGKRKCFGIFVLFLMYFSYCIWWDLEKLIWNLWGFFISRKPPGIKVSLGLSCWDTQAPADEGDEVCLWNWGFFFFFSQPGLFNICLLTISIKLIKAHHNIKITMVSRWHH